MISQELQAAIDCLTISDVYLRNNTTSFAKGFDPKYHKDDHLVLQKKHFVREALVVEMNSNHLLRVFIDFGARWVVKDDKDKEQEVKAFIEAEFVAEYFMDELLKKECIDAFALNNASYHVWPYWREFLTSQCMRMHLPRVMIPTVQLAQNKNQDHDTPS
jgi:hypothetical protein